MGRRNPPEPPGIPRFFEDDRHAIDGAVVEPHGGMVGTLRPGHLPARRELEAVVPVLAALTLFFCAISDRWMNDPHNAIRLLRSPGRENAPGRISEGQVGGDRRSISLPVVLERNVVYVHLDHRECDGTPITPGRDGEEQRGRCRREKMPEPSRSVGQSNPLDKFSAVPTVDYRLSTILVRSETSLM